MKVRPKLVDLFCKAGGASMGYHMAGFDVVGVDIEPQPNYPFEFVQANALEFDVSGFDAVAASPPCQGYGRLRHRNPRDYPRLIKPVREMLDSSGLPYVIENVEDALPEMVSPVCLCGSSFALRCRRHRLFESPADIERIPCDHTWQDLHKPYKVIMTSTRKAEGFRRSGIIPVYGGNQFVGGQERFYKSIALGIDWMTPEELNQAIPPVFTAHVGRALMKLVVSS